MAISGGTSYVRQKVRRKVSNRREAVDRALSGARAVAKGSPMPPHPAVGRQLASRVKSGAIDQEQAEHTAAERRVFERQYGKDWRRIVFGDRGYTQRTRKALAKNPESARLQALYGNLLDRRKRLYAKATE